MSKVPHDCAVQLLEQEGRNSFIYLLILILTQPFSHKFGNFAWAYENRKGDNMYIVATT